jgi:hypothetical protein
VKSALEKQVSGDVDDLSAALGHQFRILDRRRDFPAHLASKALPAVGILMF